MVPKSISEAMPGKLYEYVASQKPVILITVKGSEAEKFVSRCNAGFFADESKTDEIKESVMNCYNLWSSKNRLSLDNQYLSAFHRKNQVKLLEQVLLNG
jgi:hypothetical protein